MCVWKHPWSKVKGCHLLFSFPFIAFRCAFIFMFLSFHIHSLSCCFHVLSFCFHVLECSVPMYQRYKSSKADMPKPAQIVQVGIRPNAHMFQILWWFWLSLSFAIISLHGHVHVSLLSFLASYHFRGRRLIGSVKVKAKLHAMHVVTILSQVVCPHIFETRSQKDGWKVEMTLEPTIWNHKWFLGQTRGNAHNFRK